MIFNVCRKVQSYVECEFRMPALSDELLKTENLFKMFVITE